MPIQDLILNAQWIGLLVVHRTISCQRLKLCFFPLLPVHCNLSEDIQQSCLTVTIIGTQEIHPVIYLLFKFNHKWLMFGSSEMRFLYHTQRRTTMGRIPLDERSACRRDLYLKTHNTHNRQTPMNPVGFEPTISAGEQPQTYALDRAATGTGPSKLKPDISSS
jgi:hypothetical protein